MGSLPVGADCRQAKQAAGFVNELQRSREQHDAGNRVLVLRSPQCLQIAGIEWLAPARAAVLRPVVCGVGLAACGGARCGVR